jgi:hypothetical protein
MLTACGGEAGRANNMGASGGTAGSAALFEPLRFEPCALVVVCKRMAGMDGAGRTARGHEPHDLVAGAFPAGDFVRPAQDVVLTRSVGNIVDQANGGFVAHLR